MNTTINKEKVLIKALSVMKPKIKKSLINTGINDREDLEQEIVLRIWYFVHSTQYLEYLV